MRNNDGKRKEFIRTLNNSIRLDFVKRIRKASLRLLLYIEEKSTS